MRGHEYGGAAGRNKRVVELSVALLPKLLIPIRAFEHPPFHCRELVMRRDHTPLPVQVARGERLRHRVCLTQQAKRPNVPKLRRGHRSDDEATLSLSDDEAV